MTQGAIGIAASEPLFTALILVALLFLTRWLEHPDGSALNVLAAGFFGAAATYTRYIGVAFGLVLAVLVVRNSLQHGRSAVGRRLYPIFALGIHWALVAPLFVRNLILTGYIGGAERPISDTGFMGNLGDLGKGLFDAFPLLRTPIAEPADLIVSGLVLATATAASIVLTYRRGAPFLTAGPGH